VQVTATTPQQIPAEGLGKHHLTEDYQRYISSAKWARRKVAYYAKHPKICRACGSKEDVHLHHHTYRRLRHELDEDLVPLCEDCHVLCHQHHRDHPRWTLTKATTDFLHRRGATLNPSKRKRRQKRTTLNPRPSRGRRELTQKVAAQVSGLEIGDAVTLISQSPLLRWAAGKTGRVCEVVSPTLWRVELDEHPGSRLAVTTDMAVKSDAIILKPSPTDVRQVSCPYCQAEPGQHCMGTRGIRKANHQERIRFYASKR
jgi:hypothetical protein